MRTTLAVAVALFVGLVASTDAHAGATPGAPINQAVLGRPLTLAANEPAGAAPAAAQPNGEVAPVTLPAQAEAEKPEDATHPDAKASTEALAKAAQNPVANLISVPFQNNMNFGVGPRADQYAGVLQRRDPGQRRGLATAPADAVPVPKMMGWPQWGQRL